MSVWLLCTYLSLNLFEKVSNNNNISFLRLLLFALSTSFLLSIRVTGILIFIQYLISLIIFLNISEFNLVRFIQKFYLKFLFFLLFLIFFIFLLNPLYWISPLSFFNAIQWMSHYYHDVCTTTLGSCMKAKNLPSSYIFICLLYTSPSPRD